MLLETFLVHQELTWGASLALVFVVCGGYFLACRRQLSQDAARKVEAESLGIDRPMGQFPFIDALRCAGCAGCVTACPEGDVLGIVGGTAVVINGVRCIGIGACQEACPVDAIEIGLGDLKARVDIPLLDDHLQTNLPRVFVSGELGGLSLVSNAVKQGRQAVENIARLSDKSPSGTPDPVLDLAIVGAGPAGLSAGLTATNAGLSYVILEREKELGGTILNYPRRKMVLTQPVDLPPWGKMSKESYEKEDLLELFQGLVNDMEIDIRFGEGVKSLARQNGHYVVESDGNSYQARNVLLALGRRGNPRKLGVPGEALPKVMYRLIDAASYRGQSVLVVGGGDSAVEAAISLARESDNEVVLSYRKEQLFRIKQKNQKAIDRLIQKGAIRPIFSSQVDEITPTSVRLRVGEDTITEIQNDYVFVSIGGEPPFRLLGKFGIQFGGENA
jgi:thioredoxin reductase (NADPH)